MDPAPQSAVWSSRPKLQSWRARIGIAFALYGLTTWWSYRLVSAYRALDDFPQRDVANSLDKAQALVGVFLGPYLGSFTRHGMPCGICDSHRITFGLCAVALGLGLGLQLLPLGGGRSGSRLRLASWSLGWAVWFGSACASLLHWFG